MDFTSSWTSGARLDDAALARVDLANNVRGSLVGTSDVRRAAGSFHRAGWRVRRSSWTEFEVENVFAELELFPGDPVFFSGFTDPDRILDLLDALNGLGLSFGVEFEDPQGRLHVHRSADRSG